LRAVLDRFQARLDLAQARRIELDAVEVIVQFRHGFLQLDQCRLHAIEHRLQPGIDIDQF